MQGCALRIIEGSQFPWTWEIQGAQDMVFMENWDLQIAQEQNEQCNARTQPRYFIIS